MALIQKTVYIREEDIELWNSVSNKAAFIHNALNMRDAYLELSDTGKKVVKEHIKKLPDVFAKRQEEKTQEFCGNGHPIPAGKSKCLGKGCKYA